MSETNTAGQTQAEALRLAVVLENLGWRSVDKELRTAADELRRLHAENEALRAGYRDEQYWIGWNAAMRASQQAERGVPAPPITASIMRDDGGDKPAYCVMVAYRNARDASDALAMLAAAPVQQAERAVPAAWKHDCAALLTNDVELWIDCCPHCGKPNTAAPVQQADAYDQLVELNAELVEMLTDVTDHLERIGDTRFHRDGQYIFAARAVLAKAEAMKDSQ